MEMSQAFTLDLDLVKYLKIPQMTLILEQFDNSISFFQSVGP